MSQKLAKPLPERQIIIFSQPKNLGIGAGKRLLKNSPIYEPKSLELQVPILIIKNIAKIPKIRGVSRLPKIARYKTSL